MAIRTLKTPFPAFTTESVMGLSSPSMPASFPFDSTPNIHDRMWPQVWCPGVNYQSEQAIGCLMAIPCWERGGEYLSDVIENRLGQMKKLVTITGHTLNELAWDERTDIEDYCIRAATFIVDYGDHSFDCTNGVSVSFWVQINFFGSDASNDVFRCDDLGFFYSADMSDNILKFDVPKVGGGSIHAAWDMGYLSDDLLMWDVQFHHIVATAEPYYKPAVDGEVIGTGYYTGSTWIDNYYVITHGAAGGSSTGVVGFSLDVEQGQTLGSVNLYLPASGIGSAYPCNLQIKVVKFGGQPFPVNIGYAASLSGNLSTSHVDATVTSNTQDLNLDVTALCQLVVNDPSWNPGDNMIFYVAVASSTTAGGHYLNSLTDGTNKPALSVDAITGGTLCRLYIDGEQASFTNVDTSHDLGATEGQFVLLAHTDDTSEDQTTTLKGALKDFRIYDRPLTDGEVLDLYRVPEELYSQPLPVLHPLSLNAVIVSGHGGLVCGGSASVGITASATGGVFTGGQAVITDGGNGGMVLGGTAIPTGSTTATATGGLTIGGTATVTTSFSFVPSGGTVISDYPFRYARKITVPAGKVSEDFDNFHLGIAVQLDPMKVGEPSFSITNLSLQSIPFEVREYDDVTGRLTAYVRTPLHLATDTTLYLFYGDS